MTARLTIALAATVAVALSGCTLSFEYPPLSDGSGGGSDSGGSDADGGGSDASTARPCPRPSGLRVVTVSDSTELAAAVRALASNTEVRLEAGRYALGAALVLPAGIDNVAIRGATGRPEDVVIDGANTVTVAIDAPATTRLLVADLTVQDMAEHALVLGARSDTPTVCNAHLRNTGLAFINATRDGSDGVDRGVLERSLIEYTVASRSALAVGLSVEAGVGWIIRDNVFRNLVTPPGATEPMGPAVLMVRGSRDTVVERNVITNCDRGISFGLYASPAPDHRGGVIRNNVLYRAPGAGEQPDVGIHLAQSPDTKVLHNTVLLSGTYPSAIEVRYAGSTGVLVQGNLLDAAVLLRDGGSATRAHNITDAQGSWFVAPARLDFHLTAAATRAIDQAPARTDVPDDIDGEPRPAGVAADIGADERR